MNLKEYADWVETLMLNMVATGEPEDRCKAVAMHLMEVKTRLVELETAQVELDAAEWL